MRRMIPLSRRLLMPVLVFLVTLGLLWAFLPYQPKYDFKAFDEPGWHVEASFVAVADDGKEVVVRNGTRVHYDQEDDDDRVVFVVEIAHWDARHGKRLASERNYDSEMRPIRDHLVLDLLNTPESYPWLIREQEALEALTQKLTQSRAVCIAEAKKVLDPLRTAEAPPIEQLDWFTLPKYCGFSSDGRLFWYSTRNGLPFHGFADDEDPAPGSPPTLWKTEDFDKDWAMDGIAIDEWRTGRRIALLPAKNVYFYGLGISPDSQTAVVVTHPKLDDLSVDARKVAACDLNTGQRKTELTVHGDSANDEDSFATIEFAPNSGLAFCRYQGQVVWWDAATGKTVGTVPNAWRSLLLDDGHLLLTQSIEGSPGGYTGLMMVRSFVQKQTIPKIWNTATGESLGTLDLQHPPPPNYVVVLGSTDKERLAAMDVFPADSMRVPSPKNWLERNFPWMREQESNSTLLFDVPERREIARLPGWSAKFSPNGRWLATADNTGRVRIWELPLRRPWMYIFGFAGLAAVGFTLTVRTARFVSRWLNSRQFRSGSIQG